MYVTIEYKGVEYLFASCLWCGKLVQIQGKKKPLKVRGCFYCGQWFVEDGDEGNDPDTSPG